MGIFVRLDIIADQIDADQWATVYDMTLEVCQSCGLMVQTKREITYSGGNFNKRVLRLSISKQIERDIDNGERNWHVMGDIQSGETGESFVFYRNLLYYRSQSSIEKLNNDDILAKHVNNRCVFDSKTQGHQYHIPLLACAMLVEHHFTPYALVGGGINLKQCQLAQALLKDILGLDVKLPVCVDSQSLKSRLMGLYEGISGLKIFNQYHCRHTLDWNDPIYSIFPESQAEQWLLYQLDGSGITSFGSIRCLIEWLHGGHPLKRYLELVKNQYKHSEIITAVIYSGISLPLALRKNDLVDQEVPETINDLMQFSSIMMQGNQGYYHQVYLSDEEVINDIDCVLGVSEASLLHYHEEKSQFLKHHNINETNNTNNTDDYLKVFSHLIPEAKGAKVTRLDGPSDKDLASAFMFSDIDFDRFEKANSFDDLSGKEKEVFTSFIKMQQAHMEDTLKKGNLDSLNEIHSITLHFILMAATEKENIFIPEEQWTSIDRWKQAEDNFKLFFTYGLLTNDEKYFRQFRWAFFKNEMLFDIMKNEMGL